MTEIDRPPPLSKEAEQKNRIKILRKSQIWYGPSSPFSSPKDKKEYPYRFIFFPNKP